jgi:hypothetical protein
VPEAFIEAIRNGWWTTCLVVLVAGHRTGAQQVVKAFVHLALT